MVPHSNVNQTKQDLDVVIKFYQLFLTVRRSSQNRLKTIITGKDFYMKGDILTVIQ